MNLGIKYVSPNMDKHQTVGVRVQGAGYRVQGAGETVGLWDCVTMRL